MGDSNGKYGLKRGAEKNVAVEEGPFGKDGSTNKEGST